MLPALPALGLCQPETQGLPHTAHAIVSGPLSTCAPMPPCLSPLDQFSNPGTPMAVASKPTQVTSIAPKKDDMAYKTTPCRHFTLNRGWCPWGDECGLWVSFHILYWDQWFTWNWNSIHDPELGWVSPLECMSGSSTPCLSTLGDNKSGLPNKTAIDIVMDSHHSISSKTYRASAHTSGKNNPAIGSYILCNYYVAIETM